LNDLYAIKGTALQCLFDLKIAYGSSLCYKPNNGEEGEGETNGAHDEVLNTLVYCLLHSSNSIKQDEDDADDEVQRGQKVLFNICVEGFAKLLSRGAINDPVVSS